MSKLKRVWAAAIGAVLVLAVALGPAVAADAPSGKVMIYTSIYLHIIEQLKPVLKEKFPDLDVQWFYGGSEKVIAKLVAEFEQGATMADLIMIADPAYYNSLKRDGRLLQYDSPNHKFVLPGWVDKENYYSGVRINVVGIAYNKNTVQGAGPPQDLVRPGRPQVEGQGGDAQPAAFRAPRLRRPPASSAPPSTAGPIFEALRKNNIACEPGNGAVETKLLSGQLAVGMLLEENVLKAASEGKPLGFVYPADGPVVNPAPIGIMKTTKNPAAAKAVYDFFLDKDGQKAIIDGWMHSVRPDMPPPKGAAMKITEAVKFALPMDWDAISREPEKVKEKFDQTVLR